MSTAIQRVERSERSLQSPRFRQYLHDPVFVFPNGSGNYSRSNIAKLTESPCLRATHALFRALDKYDIGSPARLFAVGLDGLLRCQNIGERAAWVAAVLLEDSGYDVIKWCDMKSRKTRTVKGSIRLVHSRTRKQKHG